MNLFPLFIIFLSFAGFFLSFYVHHKKTTGEKLVCPLRAKCELVTHSRYSKIFGVNLEILGMLYYAAVAFSYAAFIIEPLWEQTSFGFLVAAATLGSFLFSIYLLYIQLYRLREWCSWCLASTLISTTIFILARLA